MTDAVTKRPPNAGKGRKPGVPNKTTKAAREAFQFAFDEIGGPHKLAEWAGDNLTEFYKLYGRLIPVEVQADMNASVAIYSAKPMTAEEWAKLHQK